MQNITEQSCPSTIFFGLIRATPVAYGDSQASGPVGATAAGYNTATAM